MIKLIACDVDGTLLDDQGQLDPETKAAIREAENQGIQFLICSGRSYFEVQLLLEECGLKAEAICLNGADLRDRCGVNLKTHFIEDQYVDQMQALADQRGYIVEFHCQDQTYLTCSQETLYQAFYTYETKDKDWDEAAARAYFRRLWYYNETNYNQPLAKIKQRKVVKIEFIYLPDPDYQELFHQLSGQNINVTSGFCFNNIEINDKKATKGNALKEYCELKGIAEKETVVIGDSYNDMSMFELFPCSVAVANAADDLKRCARYVTKSNNERGVERVIRAILEKNR